MNEITEAEPAQNQLPKLEPGFYFNLPELTYQRLPYFSSSTARDLAISDMTAWSNGPWFHDPERVGSDAMELGNATHALIFEGMDVMLERFQCKPTADDYPDGLNTQKDLAEWLEKHDCAKSGSKAEQIQRIYDHCEEYKLNPPVIVAECLEMASSNGKTNITPADWKKMLWRHRDIFKGEYGVPKGGAVEVAVIFNWEGVRCKMRVDYLTPDRWYDAKNFNNAKGRDLESAISGKFCYEGAGDQAVFYGLGLRTAPRVSHDKWKELFSGASALIKEPEWVGVFNQTDCPNLALRTFPGGVHNIHEGAAGVRLLHLAKMRNRWRELMAGGWEQPWNPRHEEKEIEQGSAFLRWSEPEEWQ